MLLGEFIQSNTRKKVIEYENNVGDSPLVSVCVQTYQHEKYIRECIEGILKQETTFDFELLIGEDESSDKTREICIELAQRHPEVIRLFFHSRENNIQIAGSPTGRFNLIYNFCKSRGKYIAICEGDDFWTDSLKLQRQVDLMETKSNLSASFTSALYKFENTPDKNFVYQPEGNKMQKEFGLDELISKTGDFIPTASIVLKTEFVKDLPTWVLTAPVGDLPLSLYLAFNGPIEYLPACTCVYRIMSEGSWSERMDFSKRTLFITSITEMYQKFDEFTGMKFTELVNEHIQSIQNQHKKAALKSKIAQLLPLRLIRLISPKLAKRIEYFR